MKNLFIFSVILSLLISILNGEEGKAILQGKIQTTTLSPANQTPGRIQPGSTISIKVKVKNSGLQSSAPGKIFARFALPKPLEKHTRSTLYESEIKDLPSISPGEEIEITFAKPHKWPSLYDYIREDWGMRQYQALININDHEEMIGKMPIAFSAYYYEGPSDEVPSLVPSY